MSDYISRQAAVDALWKALYEYEDETEKQFLESEELDVGEWIGYRIFVQNMNDIDRQTILNLPSAQPEQRWIPCSERLPEEGEIVLTQANIENMISLCVASRQDYNYWKGWNTREINVVAWMPLPEPYKA